MTFDDALLAFTAGLDAELAILQQVEALGAEQRAVWARDELLPLAPLATRRAALMHQLAAIENRLAPVRAQLRADVETAGRTPGYAVAESRGRDVRTFALRLMAADRAFLSDLETSLASRRREAHDLETGGATLAAYRRVVAPAIDSAALVDQRG